MVVASRRLVRTRPTPSNMSRILLDPEEGFYPEIECAIFNSFDNHSVHMDTFINLPKKKTTARKNKFNNHPKNKVDTIEASDDSLDLGSESDASVFDEKVDETTASVVIPRVAGPAEESSFERQCAELNQGFESAEDFSLPFETPCGKALTKHNDKFIPYDEEKENLKQQEKEKERKLRGKVIPKESLYITAQRAVLGVNRVPIEKSCKPDPAKTIPVKSQGKRKEKVKIVPEPVLPTPNRKDRIQIFAKSPARVEASLRPPRESYLFTAGMRSVVRKPRLMSLKHTPNERHGPILARLDIEEAAIPGGSFFGKHFASTPLHFASTPTIRNAKPRQSFAGISPIRRNSQSIAPSPLDISESSLRDSQISLPKFASTPIDEETGVKNLRPRVTPVSHVVIEDVSSITEEHGDTSELLVVTKSKTNTSSLEEVVDEVIIDSAPSLTTPDDQGEPSLFTKSQVVTTSRSVDVSSGSHVDQNDASSHTIIITTDPCVSQSEPLDPRTSDSISAVGSRDSTRTKRRSGSNLLDNEDFVDVQTDRNMSSVLVKKRRTSLTSQATSGATDSRPTTPDVIPIEAHSESMKSTRILNRRSQAIHDVMPNENGSLFDLSSEESKETSPMHSISTLEEIIPESSQNMKINCTEDMESQSSVDRRSLVSTRSDLSEFLRKSLSIDRSDDEADSSVPDRNHVFEGQAENTLQVNSTLQLAVHDNDSMMSSAVPAYGNSTFGLGGDLTTLYKSMQSDCGGRNTAMANRLMTTMRHESILIDGEDVPVPFYLRGYEDDGTSLGQLLHVVQQKGVLSWDDLPEDVLRAPRKLGEGVYGEVFGSLYNGTPTAMKVIPFNGDVPAFEGLVNGETMWEAAELIPEVLSTRELSALQDDYTESSTTNFIKLLKCHVVKGQYPDKLLEAWDLFDEKKDSENDRPSTYSSDEQLHLIIGLSMGGVDLESYQMANEKQVISVLLQAALSLVIAEEELKFEHRDLHIGNVLAQESKEDVKFRLRGRDIAIKSYGVKINIIDFTLSRLHKSGTTIFRDLEADEELFTGTGNYQFDIYRMMRQENGGIWADFEPKTNLFWLHYLATELIVNRKCKGRGITKKRQKELMLMLDQLLKMSSLSDLFTNPIFEELLNDHFMMTT